MADAGPGEHHAEQEQHHDGADVDEHLRGGHELGGQQDVLGAHRGEHGHQVQRRVHHVLRGDHPERAPHDHGGEQVEEDVLGHHQRGTLRTLAAEPAS